MTIDPTVALTPATSGVGSEAASAGPSASSGSAASDVTPPAQNVELDPKVDLFDYLAGQQPKPPAIDVLAPSSKANYLASPAALGEQVLERLEGFHQRAVDFKKQFDQGPAAPATGSDAIQPGPASSNVAGTAAPAQDDGFSRMKLVFDYAIETSLVTTTSSQFVSSAKTLMRGQ